MSQLPIGTTVITLIEYAYIAGGYGVMCRGEIVPTCLKEGGHKYHTGSSTTRTDRDVSDILPLSGFHVTESVLQWLKDNGHYDYVASRIIDVTANNCIIRIPNPYAGGGYCWILDTEKIIPSPEPDPCEGVICEDMCDNTDLYEGVCEDGSCVRGRLIETDSPTCGYIPPPICIDGEMRLMSICPDGNVIYGEICQNNKWVSSGEKCPTEPDPDPTPDETPWDMILLAGTIIILFYLFIMRQ